jgi:hypothetical protein
MATRLFMEEAQKIAEAMVMALVRKTREADRIGSEHERCLPASYELVAVGTTSKGARCQREEGVRAVLRHAEEGTHWGYGVALVFSDKPFAKCNADPLNRTLLERVSEIAEQ